MSRHKLWLRVRILCLELELAWREGRKQALAAEIEEQFGYEPGWLLLPGNAERHLSWLEQRQRWHQGREGGRSLRR